MKLKTSFSKGTFNPKKKVYIIKKWILKPTKEVKASKAKKVKKVSEILDLSEILFTYLVLTVTGGHIWARFDSVTFTCMLRQSLPSITLRHSLRLVSVT